MNPVEASAWARACVQRPDPQWPLIPPEKAILQYLNSAIVHGTLQAHSIWTRHDPVMMHYVFGASWDDLMVEHRISELALRRFEDITLLARRLAQDLHHALDKAWRETYA